MFWKILEIRNVAIRGLIWWLYTYIVYLFLVYLFQNKWQINQKYLLEVSLHNWSTDEEI